MSSNKLTVHTAASLSVTEYIARLWKYRTLITTFARRDLKIKYAQTFLGIVWVLFAPFPSVIIFTFFFGTLIKVDTGRLPYPVFALTGMIGWVYFTNLTASVGSSMIDAENIIKKIYFPKLILALSKVLTNGADFLISFAVILVVMLAFGVTPTWTIVFFPLFLVLNIICGMAIGLWVAALTIRYRDLQHIAPQLINFCIWLTPVFYPTTVLPDRLSYVMYANPMALVISGYRYTLSGGEVPSQHYLISIIPLFVLFITGVIYFCKVEDDAAEYI
ncbi:MAG TPA: ABC transporter permease [Chitinophagales bacterium]|nr:ABC transporter permease [Chitinophagales bacterium]